MWNFLAIVVIGFFVALLAPKPESQPPPAIGEIKAPTAEEGREIPVLFGTRWVKSPNVVWYGHVKVVAIRKKGGKK